MHGPMWAPISSLKQGIKCDTVFSNTNTLQLRLEESVGNDREDVGSENVPTNHVRRPRKDGVNSWREDQGKVAARCEHSVSNGSRSDSSRHVYKHGDGDEGEA